VRGFQRGFPRIRQEIKYGEIILQAAKTGSSSKVWKLRVNRVCMWSLYLVGKWLRQSSMAPVKASSVGGGRPARHSFFTNFPSRPIRLRFGESLGRNHNSTRSDRARGCTSSQR